MLGDCGCAGAGKFAQLVNAAAELLESGMAVAQASRVLAERFGCSVRQARRYVDRAAQSGQKVVPEETTVEAARQHCLA
jgi:hypothetical protein